MYKRQQSYFEELDKGLGVKQDEVYNTIQKLGSATDREIAKHLGYEDSNSTRPRRHELMEQGLVFEACKRECVVTGKQAIVWTITPPNKPIGQKFHGLSHTQFNNMKKRIDIANEHQLKHLKMYIESQKR